MPKNMSPHTRGGCEGTIQAVTLDCHLTAQMPQAHSSSGQHLQRVHALHSRCTCVVAAQWHSVPPPMLWQPGPPSTPAQLLVPVLKLHYVCALIKAGVEHPHVDLHGSMGRTRQAKQLSGAAGSFSWMVEPGMATAATILCVTSVGGNIAISEQIF